MGVPSTSSGCDLLVASQARCAAYSASKDVPSDRSSSLMLYRSKGRLSAALQETIIRPQKPQSSISCPSDDSYGISRKASARAWFEG